MGAEWRSELDELHETQADLRHLHHELRADVAIMRASFHGLDHFVSYKALVASLVSVGVAFFAAANWVLNRVETKLDKVQAAYITKEQLADVLQERPPWLSEFSRELANAAVRPPLMADKQPAPEPVEHPRATPEQLKLIERLRRKTQ